MLVNSSSVSIQWEFLMQAYKYWHIHTLEVTLQNKTYAHISQKNFFPICGLNCLKLILGLKKSVLYAKKAEIHEEMEVTPNLEDYTG